MVFSTKHGMMKHKKLKHIEEVKECSKFQTGDCGFSETFCWNRHTMTEHTSKTHEEQEQDFHQRPENLAPPERTSN